MNHQTQNTPALTRRQALRFAGQVVSSAGALGDEMSNKIKSKRTRHGMTDCTEHRAWGNMLQRCHVQTNPGYSNYGGRGICVCLEWRQSFAAFYAHIGARPSPLHSIDRIDNNRGYEPGNVKWSTRREQQQNLRKNINFTHDGETHCVREWQRRTGLDHKTITARIRSGLASAEVLARGRRPNGMSKLNIKKAGEIKRRIASGESLSSLARRFGVTVAAIFSIKDGRTWRHA